MLLVNILWCWLIQVTLRLPDAIHNLPEGQAMKITFFAPRRARVTFNMKIPYKRKIPTRTSRGLTWENKRAQAKKLEMNKFFCNFPTNPP